MAKELTSDTLRSLNEQYLERKREFDALEKRIKACILGDGSGRCPECQTEFQLSNDLPACDCVEQFEKQKRNVMVEGIKIGQQRDNERERIRRIADRIERNRPGRFADASVSNWVGADQHPEIQRKAQEYVDGFESDDESSVMLLGSVGTGKTSLLYGIANDLIYRDVEVLVINVAAWIQQIQFEIGRSGLVDDVIEPAKQAECLGLVDLGKESTTEYTRRTLYLLLEERWQQRRPMIVDSNFESFSALHDHYGNDPVMREAIASRIGGMCKGRIWTLDDDQDRRLSDE